MILTSSCILEIIFNSPSWKCMQTILWKHSNSRRLNISQGELYPLFMIIKWVLSTSLSIVYRSLISCSLFSIRNTQAMLFWDKLTFQLENIQIISGLATHDSPVGSPQFRSASSRRAVGCNTQIHHWNTRYSWNMGITLFCVQLKEKPVTNPTSSDLANAISTEEGKQMDTLLQELCSPRNVQLEVLRPIKHQQAWRKSSLAEEVQLPGPSPAELCSPAPAGPNCPQRDLLPPLPHWAPPKVLPVNQ